jgi:hypothetical protein
MSDGLDSHATSATPRGSPAGFWGKAFSLLGGVVIGAALMAFVFASGLADRWLPANTPGAWGRFSGNPKTEWIVHEREMQLLEDFAYIDAADRAWVAPKGSIIDGASIPRALWTVVGSPYVGDYRNASIVHDVECRRRTIASDDVHRMFYEACRCGGIKERRAKTLYAAVYLFGPRWAVRELKETKTYVDETGATKTAEVRVFKADAIARPAAVLDEADVRKLETYIEKNNPTLEQIQALDVEKL